MKIAPNISEKLQHLCLAISFHLSIAQWSFQVYNPGADQWTPMPEMTTKRSAGAAAMLGTRLFAVGGHDGSGRLATVEALDPRAGAWGPVKSMANKRSGLAVCAMGERLYAIGGHDGYGRLASVEVCRVLPMLLHVTAEA